jgi:cyclic beta-1,2-glucan synthetase
MHRAAIESICGLQLQGRAPGDGQARGSVLHVRLRPRLPSHWPSITLTLNLHGRRHAFSICSAAAADDIARAGALGAQPLAAGQWLALDELGAASHHLVVCHPPAAAA